MEPVVYNCDPESLDGVTAVDFAVAFGNRFRAKFPGVRFTVTFRAGPSRVVSGHAAAVCQTIGLLADEAFLDCLSEPKSA